jgi:hypothetical protein
MPPPNRTGPAVGTGPAPNTLADGALGVDSILEQPSDTAAAYVVIVVSPYGQPRRRVYLSRHHATAALRRAQDKGQEARMMLCRLEPVPADLDGEVPSD